METTSRKAKKQRATLQMVGAVVGLILGVVVLVRSEMLGLPSWLVFVLMVVIMAGTFWALMPWWRGLDHMQKDAQYQSWYWGGNFGAAVALVGLMIFASERTELITGAIGLFMAQLIGHAICWLIWLIWRIRNGGGGF